MTFHEIRGRADQVRGIPLEAVLVAAGAERDRHDKAKWHTPKGVLSVTGMKFMNWNLNLGGGGAIDLAIHLNDLGFKAAVEWLWRHFPGCPHSGRIESSPGPGLRLPRPYPGKLSCVKRYLVRDRGIATSLIDPLIESGRLYADNRANAVFVLLGKEKRPVGAELRGTSGRTWRGLAPGSRKNLGYFSVPAARGEGIILCESAIDAVSCFALHPRYRCISTAGARPGPRWLASLVSRGEQVYCGFDADQVGESMARAMIARYPGVKRLRPSRHDWNEVLKAQA